MYVAVVDPSESAGETILGAKRIANLPSTATNCVAQLLRDAALDLVEGC